MLNGERRPAAWRAASLERSITRVPGGSRLRSMATTGWPVARNSWSATLKSRVVGMNQSEKGSGVDFSLSSLIFALPRPADGPQGGLPSPFIGCSPLPGFFTQSPSRGGWTGGWPWVSCGLPPRLLHEQPIRAGKDMLRLRCGRISSSMATPHSPAAIRLRTLSTSSLTSQHHSRIGVCTPGPHPLPLPRSTGGGDLHFCIFASAALRATWSFCGFDDQPPLFPTGPSG
jgi:hypothetical protein